MIITYSINIKEEKIVYIHIYGKHFDKAIDLEESIQR